MNNNTPPNAPKKVNGNMSSYNGDIVPFELSSYLPMLLLHRQHANSTHNVCGICATPTSNDCSNHSDYFSLCNKCCTKERPVTPTGQRTSPMNVNHWSKVLDNQRKNERQVCLEKTVLRPTHRHRTFVSNL